MKTTLVSTKVQEALKSQLEENVQKKHFLLKKQKMLTLQPGQRVIIKSILATYVSKAEVRMLDARVNWVAREPLDLYLVILGSSPLDPDTRNDIEEALAAAPEIDELLIDVVEWHTYASLPSPRSDYGFEFLKEIRDSIEQHSEVIQRPILENKGDLHD